MKLTLCLPHVEMTACAIDIDVMVGGDSVNGPGRDDELWRGDSLYGRRQ